MSLWMTFLADAQRPVLRAGVSSWAGEADVCESVKDQDSVAIEVAQLLCRGIIPDAQQRVGSTRSHRFFALCGAFRDGTAEALGSTYAQRFLAGARGGDSPVVCHLHQIPRAHDRR
eukprot:scaffold1859_cov202-Pinguiococcus_pyrenoidosus.AAC.1